MLTGTWAESGSSSKPLSVGQIASGVFPGGFAAKGFIFNTPKNRFAGLASVLMCI
jgi:hypothetical protein